jgi:hypothetical protein
MMRPLLTLALCERHWACSDCRRLPCGHESWCDEGGRTGLYRWFNWIIHYLCRIGLTVAISSEARFPAVKPL